MTKSGFEFYRKFTPILFMEEIQNIRLADSKTIGRVSQMENGIRKKRISSYI